jgi:hypothetical protein
MIPKIVRPDSFGFDQPVASLVPVHSRGIDKGWFQKSAAVLTEEMAELRPEPGRTFVHLIALGDSEAYGMNRNGDLFPKEANVKYHKTFEKHANFYRHHRNKPKLGHKIYGTVKNAAYNPDMQRVELIVSIDNEAAPDTVEKLASGKDIPVSMACQVPFDICTVCQNKASNKSEYCEHIEKNAGQVLDDGRLVGMINTQPKFFDISEVTRNADRIAFSLRKVASAGRVVTGAELAAQMQLDVPSNLQPAAKQRKLDLLSKLAHVEAQVEEDMRNNPAMRNVALELNKPAGVEKSASDAQLGGVLGLFKRSNACLPMNDFFKLTLGDRYDEVEHMIPSARASLPSAFRRAEKQACAFVDGAKTYEPLDSTVPVVLKKEVERVVKSAALDLGGLLERRLMKQVLLKDASEVISYDKGGETPGGRYLADQYAMYKLAFLDGADDNTVRMAVVQNF